MLSMLKYSSCNMPRWGDPCLSVLPLYPTSSPSVPSANAWSVTLTETEKAETKLQEETGMHMFVEGWKSKLSKQSIKIQTYMRITALDFKIQDYSYMRRTRRTRSAASFCQVQNQLSLASGASRTISGST